MRIYLWRRFTDDGAMQENDRIGGWDFGVFSMLSASDGSKPK
jgi:hypothetical protein